MLRLPDLPARTAEVRLRLVEARTGRQTEKGVVLDLHFETNVLAAGTDAPLLYSLTTYAEFAERSLFGSDVTRYDLTAAPCWYRPTRFPFRPDGARLVYAGERGRWCFERGLTFVPAAPPPALPVPRKSKRLALPPGAPPPDVFDPPPVAPVPRAATPVVPRGAQGALSRLRDESGNEETAEARSTLSVDLETLHAGQRAAALHAGGPLLIIAGAGSGKTKTLTALVGSLVLERGVEPRRILCSTFTKKAGEELTARLDRYLGPGERAALTLGTFHSIAYKLLLEEAAGTPLAGRLRHLLGTDAAPESGYTLLRKVLGRDPIPELGNERGVDDPDADARVYASVLGLLANDLVPPGDRAATRAVLLAAGRLRRGGHQTVDRFARAHELYSALKKAAGVADFDDLLVELWELLRRSPEKKARLQERFRWVLVDEAQDCSRAQHELAALLSAGTGNLVLVGDDYQSIYAWRGARPAYLLNFQQRFPAARTALLGINYRSTPEIVALGAKVISYNRNQLPKVLTAARASLPGVSPEFRAFPGRRAEAAAIVDLLVEHRDAGVPLGELAVLYRTNAQSAELEAALLRKRLPYRTEGQLGFYRRQEIADLLAYLRLATGGCRTAKEADEALARIVNRPTRYLGRAWLEAIAAARTSGGCDPGDSLLEVARVAGVGTRWDRGQRALLELLDALTAAPDPLAAWAVLDGSYGAWLRRADAPEEDNDRRENVVAFGEVLRAWAETGGTLPDFLTWIRTAEAAQRAKQAVRLLTFHRAKGLEFRVVVLAGVEVGVLPHPLNPDREEERRLLYVGITRARDHLYLTCGGTPSPFLNEAGLLPPSESVDAEAGTK